jgi:hypothetical protein
VNPTDDPTTNAPTPSSSGKANGWPFTLIIAAYGAVVSSGVALYQFLRDRPGVRVFISPSTTIIDGADDRHVEIWRIRFVNHRKRPITIEEGGILLPGNLQLPALSVDHLGEKVPYPFPMTLGDGESQLVQVSRNDELIDVRGAWARDALDRVYKARYPSRRPLRRIKAWQENREFKKRMRG